VKRAPVAIGETVKSACPSCGVEALRQTYDIGSGAELSCANCEWCWGANGQDLIPLMVEMGRCPKCGRMVELSIGFIGAHADRDVTVVGMTAKMCKGTGSPPRFRQTFGRT
jgi:predicted RNA-binding Zn-ribbon protein involved in translation (DUF1610 family)